MMTIYDDSVVTNNSEDELALTCHRIIGLHHFQPHVVANSLHLVVTQKFRGKVWRFLKFICDDVSSQIRIIKEIKFP